MNKDLMFSSKNQKWETPQDFYDKLNEEFGFTLDPCCEIETAKCSKFYTPKEDGLIQDWEGETVFCNPPYGRDQKLWIKKCWNESNKPKTTVVMLVPARTDTIAFHKYIYNKSEIRFIKGSLKFGNSKNSAPFPSMVVIFRAG